MAIRRDDHHTDTARTERVERIEHVDRAAPPAGTNVNVGPSVAVNDPVVAVTRVVTLIFTVLEVLLFIRFTLKLLGANVGQPLVNALYRFTDILVRPFQGIFPEPQGVPVVIDLAALLAVLFLFLVAALIVALVRSIAGRQVY